MDKDSKPVVCRRCGNAIPAEAPTGWCPQCALATLLIDGPEDHSLEVLSLQDIPQPGANISYIGDYELLEVIAHGGMGVVYKARQKSLNRIVALKLLLGGVHASADFRKRFRQEAELAAQLHHPNIVPIYEAGEHEGQPYFSMEYVPGQDLASLTRDKPLQSQQAAEYLKTIAEAVHYAHLQGVLHRDLKPSNVLLGSDGRLRITDFGLAKRFADSSTLTLSGATLGTPGYLPPEQISTKHGTVGISSDVYSLGAILYHLLTGQPPFAGETLVDMLNMVLHSKPVPPSHRNLEVVTELETVCLKCLAKEPNKRYRSALELAEALKKCRTDGGRTRGWSRISRPVTVSLLLLAFAAVGLLLWQFLSRINSHGTNAVETATRGVYELASDPNTLLLLHCNGNLDGAGGEKPESVAGVAFEKGVVGAGAYFSRGNEVYFSTSNNLSVTNGTLEFWIKPRWSENDRLTHPILSVGSEGGFFIGKDWGNYWRLIFNRHGSAKMPEGDLGFKTDWRSNEWHHLAIVWTPTFCKAYSDGMLVIEKQNNFPPPPVRSPMFRFGADYDAFSVDAVIDEIRISDRERTAEEIRQSYLRVLPAGKPTD